MGGPTRLDPDSLWAGPPAWDLINIFYFFLEVAKLVYEFACPSLVNLLNRLTISLTRDPTMHDLLKQTVW